MLLEVQGLIDHAVRRAAWAPSLNESVLRLPAQLGGLATPALQDEIAVARVATWMRIMASPTRAAKILQNEMRRITHFNGEQGDLFRAPVNPAPLQRGGRPAYRDAIRATCTAFELIKDLRQLDLTIQLASPEPPLLRRPTTMMDSCTTSGIRMFFQPVVDTLVNMLQNGGDSSWEVFGCSDGGVNYSEGIITAGFALKITSASGAVTTIQEGWRIALTGHGSPVFLSEFAELEAMEGMLYALQLAFENLVTKSSGKVSSTVLVTMPTSLRVHNVCFAKESDHWLRNGFTDTVVLLNYARLSQSICAGRVDTPLVRTISQF